MKTYKIIALFVVLVLGFNHTAKADEGMWLPFMISEVLHEQMQEKGLNLSREEIFSLKESSLKDAIVSFGGGCTGEIISDQGLLLTNHHCGYGRIQSHSTTENDYLSDGFWAMSMDEELPNPNLFVNFLVDVEEVTDDIYAEIDESMSKEERTTAISRVSNRLIDEATEGTHYHANVRSMFAGNEFFLFVYERFDDVRLVGAPPSSIGKFGGDTDNWMWPRHTGDFALFRVYTAPDGSPASYHEENIPLKPRHHLPVSAKGVQDGDFTMILGFPGSTQRYLTSHGINYKLEYEYPVRIDIRRKKLDIIEEAMAQSDEIRIKYASKQSGIANYWKNFIGVSNALERLNVAQSKKEIEAEFENWVNEDANRMEEYAHVMDLYSEAYEGYESFQSHHFIFWEAILTGPDVIRNALAYRTLANLMQEEAEDEKVAEEVEKLRETIEGRYNNYDRGVDQELWAAMIKVYNRDVPEAHKPEIFEDINQTYQSDFSAFAHDVYNTSVFATADNLQNFLDKPTYETLEDDWVFRVATTLMDTYSALQNQMSEYDDMLATAERLFIKGLKEMNPDKLYYPDANSTMRFTYGTVGGYEPADAVYYDYVTTLSGVMEKEDPEHHEFIVPQELKDLYDARDYSWYGEDDTMIVNFIANNDITGGNSGSPVLDGDGNLIGLAFDGNWEAMSMDILFEHQMQKCINVDARYILFIIDKFAGASHLIDEMTIVR